MRHRYLLPIAAVVLALAFAVPARAAEPAPGFLTDVPDERSRAVTAFTDAPSYEAAMRLWKTPGDINAWIGGRFTYDMDRAKRFASPVDGKSLAGGVLAPEQLFAGPTGICVDLARFGVESLRRIDPQAEARYLRIEFEPVSVGGATLRFHWLALFRHGGDVYVFADSKRPGHMAGPYASTDAFIADYAKYRQRAIVGYRELDTFRRTVKKTVRPSPG